MVSTEMGLAGSLLGHHCGQRSWEASGDSQERVEEEASQVQIARLHNGTTRPLTDQEANAMLMAELVEEEAAEMEREREYDQWQRYEGGQCTPWEVWARSAEAKDKQ